MTTQTRKEKMMEMKEWLKSAAKEIRALKKEFKQEQRDRKSIGPTYSRLIRLQWDYRAKHIAYSLARGRTMDQICRRPKKEGKVYFLDNIPYGFYESCGMRAIGLIQADLMLDDSIEVQS